MISEHENKPHLLYVAFAFPPSTASSVYRCLAVPNAFAAAGWDVTVLTIDGETWSEISGTDNELLSAVDPAVRVVRVTDGGSEDRAKGDIRTYSRFRIEAPYVWQAFLSLRSRRSFPETFHGLWLKPASNAARRIHQEHKVDLVIGSASPYVSFEVAQSLPGVPYVMDYRDAWAFHTFTGRQNFAPDSKTGRLESKYLEGATQVWFVNDQIREEYARRYPSSKPKLRVVPNGFDPQPGHAKPAVKAATRPTFGYLGTLQHENNPLDELLNGWVDAFGVSPTQTTSKATAIIRGKLSSSGSVSPQLLRKFAAVRPHGMEYGGPVPKRQVSRFYQQLDALILLLPSGKYITGGKTAEYLATGLPIVSVHELGNATTEMLRDYPLWFPAEELTASAVSSALRACADTLLNPDPSRWEAAWEYGQSFLRSAMLAPVIDELTHGATGRLSQCSDALASAPLEVDDRVVLGGRTLETPSVVPPPADEGREVSVVVLVTEGGKEVLQDLRARIMPLREVRVSLEAFVADTTEIPAEAHMVRIVQAGPAERIARRAAGLVGPIGMVGRLVRESLYSRRLARSVRRDSLLMERALTADVVMAADSRATRAVWQLRSSSKADLVKGAVALVHVLRKQSGAGDASSERPARFR